MQIKDIQCEYLTSNITEELNTSFSSNASSTSGYLSESSDKLKPIKREIYAVPSKTPKPACIPKKDLKLLTELMKQPEEKKVKSFDRKLAKQPKKDSCNNRKVVHQKRKNISVDTKPVKIPKIENPYLTGDWKTRAEALIRNIFCHSYSFILIRPKSKKKNAISNKVSRKCVYLEDIKKYVANGTIKTDDELKRFVLLMCSDVVMSYSKTCPEYKYAEIMQKYCSVQINDFIQCREV